VVWKEGEEKEEEAGEYEVEDVVGIDDEMEEEVEEEVDDGVGLCASAAVLMFHLWNECLTFLKRYDFIRYSNDTRKEKRKGPGQRTLLHVKDGDKAVRVGENPLVKFAKEASLIGSSYLGVRVAPLFLGFLVLANMRLSMPAPNVEG
jgi:hypothetical protein